MPPVDPVALTQALIRRPSVTPADAGAMDVVEGAHAVDERAPVAEMVVKWQNQEG